MASPIKVHRPKCDFAGSKFRTVLPNRGNPVTGYRCTCFELPNGLYPEILPDVNYNLGFIVCRIEWRQYLNDDKGDWYVFAVTTAPDVKWRFYDREGPGDVTVLANNATQARQFMLNNPNRFPEWGPGTNNTPKDSIMIDTDSIRRQAAALLAEADRIDNLPSEPRSGVHYLGKKKAERLGTQPTDIDVVWWTMVFKGGRQRYVYAAVRTPDGRWSTTGPRSPKSYTWDDLIAWIDRESQDVVEIYLGTVWDQIS